eukprot:scaffold44_cov339-Pavlova_lutheri.AAC.43
MNDVQAHVPRRRGNPNRCARGDLSHTLRTGSILCGTRTTSADSHPREWDPESVERAFVGEEAPPGQAGTRVRSHPRWIGIGVRKGRVWKGSRPQIARWGRLPRDASWQDRGGQPRGTRVECGKTPRGK